jgi:hypothetical protein
MYNNLRTTHKEAKKKGFLHVKTLRQIHKYGYGPDWRQFSPPQLPNPPPPKKKTCP